MELVKTGVASKILGVTPQTIRKYADQGLLKCYVTKTNQFLFDKKDLYNFLGIEPENIGTETVFYIRSSTGQKASLKSQEELLESKFGTPTKVYKDTGSGLNDKRPGLSKLIRDAQKGKITRVCITHKDRLTRFGYNYLEELFKQNGVAIEYLSQDEKQNLQEELLQDFMSLIASFSGKFYRLRGYEQQRKLLATAEKKISEKEARLDE